MAVDCCLLRRRHWSPMAAAGCCFGRMGDGDARQLSAVAAPLRWLLLASVAASDRILFVSVDAKLAVKGATAADKPPRGSTSLFHVRMVEDLSQTHEYAFYKLMNGIMSLTAPHKRDRRRDGAEN